MEFGNQSLQGYHVILKPRRVEVFKEESWYQRILLKHPNLDKNLLKISRQLVELQYHKGVGSLFNPGVNLKVSIKINQK